MRWSPLRLVQKRWKALYIVGGLVVSFVIFRLIDLIPSELVSSVLSSLVDFSWIYFGTRVFRGPDEIILTARPWWRMTAKPKTGFVFGTFWVVLLVATFVPTSRHDSMLELNPVVAIVSAFEFALLAFLYLGSSVRLRKEAKVAATNPTT